MAQREERITDGSRGRLALSGLVLVLGALLAVALTPIFDSQVVRTHSHLRKVEFGLPAPWLEQDQSGTVHNLPWKAKLQSVGDNPTSVKPVGLAIDLGAAFALEALVVGIAFLIVRRRDS
jgi:hypothetical protein